MFDLVIRGGTVVDGTGTGSYVADVAIEADKIAAVGPALGRGAEEIDARGLIVTPGFIDLHTHFDGQVIWEDRFVPLTAHGVTTLVMGNCGFGFAPCRPGDRDTLIQLMDGVEDIPADVLRAGIHWQWESFPEYLDALATRRTDADFLALLPHAPLRVYVMGKRGIAREGASRDDLAQLTKLTEEAIRAGAVGVSTSHTTFHRSASGALSPIETACEEELKALGRGMRNAGAGLWEMLCTFYDIGEDGATNFDLMKRLVAHSGRPMTFTVLDAATDPTAWPHILRLTAQANAEGLAMKGQVHPKLVGFLLGLDLSLTPFSLHPAYRAIAHLPLAERVERLRDPVLRKTILSQKPQDDDNVAMIALLNMVSTMFVVNSPANYEPPADELLGAIAKRSGRTPHEVAYDALLESDGKAILCLPVANFNGASLDNALTMMRDPNCVIGLGDAGAHYGLVCDSSYPTFMLTHWVRDRKGERVPLEWAVKRLTSDNASFLGLNDRGLLKAGYKADLNVIDVNALRLDRPHVKYDLPMNGRRLSQDVAGYRATILSGEITYENGVATNNLPGRLVRAGAHSKKPQAQALAS